MRLLCDGEEHEAERAVARIQALRGTWTSTSGADLKFADFACSSAPTTSHVCSSRSCCARRRSITGRTKLFRPRRICAGLRLLVNNDDDPAFLRAVTTPKRGIGHQTLAALGEFASLWKVSPCFEALFSPSLGAALKGKAVDSLHEFGREVNLLQDRAAHTTGAKHGQAPAAQLARHQQHLHDGEDSEKIATARWSNVLDFVDWIARRRRRDRAGAGALRERTQQRVRVAQTISVIISLADRGEELDVVTLSTLHAAKGLEWAHVVRHQRRSAAFAAAARTRTPR